MLLVGGMTAEFGNAATIDWRVFDDVRPMVEQSRPDRLGRALTADDIAAFDRDGGVLLPGAFSSWVEPLRDGLDRILADPASFAFPCESTAPGEPGRFFDAYCNWQRVPQFLDYVLFSDAASVAAQLMGSDSAQLFHEHVFAKEPGTEKATPWHQDLPYYCVDGSQTASIYVALDDIPAETAVAFVKGSHRTGRTHVPRRFLDGSDYASADTTLVSEPEPDADAVFRADLTAGDTYVFDFRTLHGSGAAPTTRRRRAFSPRWLGDDAHYVERPGPTSPPLSDLGVDPGDRMRPDWFPVLWP